MNKYTHISATQDALEVNLKFFKNVTNNRNLLNEIHKAITNFRPIILKHVEDKDVTINYELYDDITKEAINTKIHSKIKHKYQAMLQKYEAHAMKRGKERLRDIRYYMSIELHIRKDILPPTHSFLKNFTKKARVFFDKLYKQTFKTDIGKEYSLLDTVQTFNGIVYDEELTLLNDMIFKYHVNMTTDTMMIILKHFYYEFIDSKKADTDYLCLKFEICRPTLRFTENAGDVARELLKLSDAKLTYILFKLLIYIKNHSEFFELILGKSSVIEIGTKLENLIFRDVSGLRTIFVEFRSYLDARHKFTPNSNEVNIRNKALHILMDIIDQSFDIDGDEVLAMHFNIILKNIIDWSEGRKNELEKVLKSFVTQAVGLMKINLSDDAIKEIPVLVDVLLRKENKNNKIYRYLMNHGSTFVRGEDIPLKISLLI